MKKIIIAILVLGVIYSCKKETPLTFNEQLVSNPNGWTLASYTHKIDLYSTDYDHYTNVGNFIFYDDGKGEYSYEGTTARFIYYATDEVILLKFYYSEISDYSSPLLFFGMYYSNSYYDDYGSGWEDAFELNVEKLTDYSLRLWNPYIGIEMLLYKSE